MIFRNNLSLKPRGQNWGCIELFHSPREGKFLSRDCANLIFLVHCNIFLHGKIQNDVKLLIPTLMKPVFIINFISTSSTY